MADRLTPPPDVDVTVPNTARMYDYYLGGDNNFQADRDAAENVLHTVPWIRRTAVENRAFLRRAVAHLTREAGIRQFVDIGAGLSTQGNVHEIAHAIAPETRVVYVDHDPLVLTHNRELLAGTDNAIIVQADLRDPESIITDTDITSFIDWNEPIGLLLVAVLHFITPEDDPAAILRRFRDVMAPGSHLALTHIDFSADDAGFRHLFAIYDNAGIPLVTRDRDQVATFFAGFDLLEPGLVGVREWHPEDAGRPPEDVGIIGGAGRLQSPA